MTEPSKEARELVKEIDKQYNQYLGGVVYYKNREHWDEHHAELIQYAIDEAVKTTKQLLNISESMRQSAEKEVSELKDALKEASLFIGHGFRCTSRKRIGECDCGYEKLRETINKLLEDK